MSDLSSACRNALVLSPARPALLLMLSAVGGCGIFFVPLYKTDVTPAGEGLMRISPASPADSAASELLTILTAVYHYGKAVDGRPLVEFGLLAPVRNADRPAENVTRYLNFQLQIDPLTGRANSLAAENLVFLTQPAQGRTTVHRYTRLTEPVVLVGQPGGGRPVSARLALELVPVNVRTPTEAPAIRLEVEFRAEPDWDLLNRMKRAYGNDVRDLEDAHLRRTARPPAELESLPVPELLPTPTTPVTEPSR